MTFASLHSLGTSPSLKDFSKMISNAPDSDSEQFFNTCCLKDIQMNWDDLQYHKCYSSKNCYKQSKLALILFTNELNHQLAGIL